MEVKELGHIVLYVRDLERSRRFYGDVLGWRPIDAAIPGAALFSSGRTHHELLLLEVGANAAPVPPGRRIGLYHFGLKVGESDDELREALTTLQENNVKIAGATDHTVTHSLYMRTRTGTRSSCTSTSSRRFGKIGQRRSSLRHAP